MKQCGVLVVAKSTLDCLGHCQLSLSERPSRYNHTFQFHHSDVVSESQ